MCALCGLLGGDEHWADAVARDGVYTQNTDPARRRRERASRVQVANRALKPYGLRLSDWQGASFLLSTLTGKSEVIGDLGHLCFCGHVDMRQCASALTIASVILFASPKSIRVLSRKKSSFSTPA